METGTIINIIETLNALWGPIKIFAILIGYLLVGIGLFSFAMSMHDKYSVSSYASFMMIITGFMLVSIDAFLTTASYSLFDQSSELDVFGYTGADASSSIGHKYTILVFAILKFLGLIAGIKGIYTLYSQSKDEKQSIFTAIMFLIVAVIGLNFPHFLDMIGATLGGTAQVSIDRILDFSR